MFDDRGIELKVITGDGSAIVYSYVKEDGSIRFAYMRSDGYWFVEQTMYKASNDIKGEVNSLIRRKADSPLNLMNRLIGLRYYNKK